MGWMLNLLVGRGVGFGPSARDQNPYWHHSARASVWVTGWKRPSIRLPDQTSRGGSMPTTMPGQTP
jgi:hypothetical protein